MEIIEVKRQIKDGQLRPFYIFTGDEIEAQNIYVQKIAEVSGKPLQRIDGVAQALGKRGGLLRQSHCFVCRDDAEFVKAEKNVADVAELLGNNILILLMTKIDGRSKFSKTFKDEIVTFNHMEHDVLAKYTRKALGGGADAEAVEDLMEVCEGDYGRVLLESDKVLRYSEIKGMSAGDAVRALLKEGVINRPPRDAIFDLCDAVMRYDVNKTYASLSDCSAIGEAPLAILKVLYRNVRRTLQVQTATGDIEKATGLSSWDIKCVRDYVGVWESTKLVYMLKLIQKIEAGIKRGIIEEQTAIPYMLTHIF